MFSVLLKTCTDCDNLEDAICAIDAVLAQFGKNLWQNTAFMTSKPLPYVKIRQLMYYKEILTHLRWNQDFYCPYKYPQIVSRVKALTAGEFTTKKRQMPIYAQSVCECGPLPSTTTTTTTSTTSTTSTTTSSTTTTTTTLVAFMGMVQNRTTADNPIYITDIRLNGVSLQPTHVDYPIGPEQSTPVDLPFADVTLGELEVDVTGDADGQSIGAWGYIEDLAPSAICQSYTGEGSYLTSSTFVVGFPDMPLPEITIIATYDCNQNLPTANMYIDNQTSLTVYNILVDGIPVELPEPSVGPSSDATGVTQQHPEGVTVVFYLFGTNSNQCAKLTTSTNGTMCRPYVGISGSTNFQPIIFENVVINDTDDISLVIVDSSECDSCE